MTAFGGAARRAAAVVELARDGRFEEIAALFAAPLRPVVPAEALHSAWDAAIAAAGPLRSTGAPVVEEAPLGGSIVKIPVACEHAVLVVVASMTALGELTGLQLAPPSVLAPPAAWEPPDYVDPERFTEEDVTLGDSPLAVSGSLSVPRGRGPHPALVLLAGSGPNDRDETIGRNKPLKDLAWGLSSRGVAVLRFDKVTFVHPGEVQADGSFTMADEYVPHALAALRVLRTRPELDASRLFVAGHSMGGTVAPRVAREEPSLRGLVLLAAGAIPAHRAAARQLRYLASLDPTAAGAASMAADAMDELVRRVDSPDLAPDTPCEELPFGVPAPYWLDVRAYDPVALAAVLATPVLVLQGGRDYQVTVEDDLARWREGLAGRAGVEIRVYPADNHLFFSGEGPSAPGEYEPAQHVDGAVVADVARWVRDAPPARSR